jgi:hypothetical protein
VDSPYYSELELCGGVVMVSFSKYLPWQVMHFLQCSTHFSKTCCRPLITSKFLASELPFHVWKSPEIAWAGQDLDCMADVLMGLHCINFFQAEHRIQFRSCPMWFLGFSNHEKGAPRQEISKLLMVCNTFLRSGWSIVRSASLAKGGTSRTKPSLHLHKVPTWSNQVSPWTLQTALVIQNKMDSVTLVNYMNDYALNWHVKEWWQ